MLYIPYYIQKQAGKGRAKGQTGKRENQGSASTVCHPSRLVLVLSPPPQVVREGKSKAADETGRERTRAKDAAAIFARPLPLFCSVCCPHRPHHRQRSPSRPLTLSQKGREGRPPRPRPLPLRQVVKVGQRARQGGRSLPLTLPTLSTLPGCVRIYAETSGEEAGGGQP